MFICNMQGQSPNQTLHNYFWSPQQLGYNESNEILFFFLIKLLVLLGGTQCGGKLTSAWLGLELGTLGAWWLRADRQARMRWMAPISSAMRLSSTPSSVVSGVVLNKLRNTWKGRVGSTFAEGDCRMWPRPEQKHIKPTFYFNSSVQPINLCKSSWTYRDLLRT